MNRNIYSLVWDGREMNTKFLWENANRKYSLDYLGVDWDKKL